MHLNMNITGVTQFFHLIYFNADKATSQRREIVKLRKISTALFMILV